ncbi:intracellular multiplication protein IcmL [Piscirickettsia salmonis]|nr:intracellular multiplication protein IcmL [Piscirickettsia salmonis]
MVFAYLRGVELGSQALNEVKLRNDFYRDNFRRVALILLISIMINLIILIFLIVSLTTKPKPNYFAVTDSGRLIKLQSLANPAENDAYVINWLSNAVVNINTLDFLNYRNQTEGKRQYFTQYGWGQYLKAFKNIIGKIKSGQYVSRAVVTDAPVVIQKGIVSGVYSWRLQVPVTITYQKGNSKDTQNLVWTVLVQRNDDSKDSLMGISQIVQVKGSS